MFETSFCILFLIRIFVHKLPVINKNLKKNEILGMNNLLIRFLAGFLCIARLIKYASGPPCITRHLRTGLEIDCSGQQIFSVPKNLDPDARGLDLSNNDMCSFSRQNFSRYLGLMTLRMTKMRCSSAHGSPNPQKHHFITFTANTFVDLKSLVMLDISDSPMIYSLGSQRFAWPMNLRQLTLDNDPRIAFNFSELNKLEYLFASNCSKSNFPKLHPEAPLQIIDLGGNNITDMTVEMVAGYCELETLNLSTLLNDSKPKPPYDDIQCTCKRLKEWARLKKIKGLENLRCITIPRINTPTTEPEPTGRTEPITATTSTTTSTSTTTVSTTIDLSHSPTWTRKTTSVQRSRYYSFRPNLTRQLYSDEPKNSCDLSFDEAESLYQNCVSKRTPGYFHVILVLIGVVLVLLPITWCLSKAFRIYRGRVSEAVSITEVSERDFSSSYYGSSESVSEGSDSETVPPTKQRNRRRQYNQR